LSEDLIFYAGEKAYSLIMDNGLKPSMVKVLAGASGGPKWLVLSGLDRAICSSFFKDRKEILFLVGSSIGAWRFAALSHNEQIEAIERFENVYITQTYSSRPDVEEITAETQRVLDAYVGEDGVMEILNHPTMRLSILAVSCNRFFLNDNRLSLGAGMAAASMANVFSRTSLKYFFKRALFYDPRDKPPFFDMDGFPIERIPLSEDNLKQAIMASGSIPMAMAGVRNISGTSAGVYRDGGIIDYHLDIPFMIDDGIVLYPHYTDRIIPGWFDKKLKWRRPDSANMENVLLVGPSDRFLQRLPLGRIPDRRDFKYYQGKDAERVAAWKKVLVENKRLGDGFLEAVETGKIRDLVKPVF